MDLDCLSQNVSISRLHDYQKWVNICVFCEYYDFPLLKREIYTFSAKQLKSIKNSEIFRTTSSFENIFIYLLITTRLQIKIVFHQWLHEHCPLKRQLYPACRRNTYL